MLPPSAVMSLSAAVMRVSSALTVDASALELSHSATVALVAYPPEEITCITPAESSLVSDSTLMLPPNAVMSLSAELTRASSADVTAVSVLPANRTAAAVFSRYLVSASEGSSPSVSGSRIMRPSTGNEMYQTRAPELSSPASSKYACFFSCPSTAFRKAAVLALSGT